MRFSKFNGSKAGLTDGGVVFFLQLIESPIASVCHIIGKIRCSVEGRCPACNGMAGVLESEKKSYPRRSKTFFSALLLSFNQPENRRKTDNDL